MASGVRAARCAFSGPDLGVVARVSMTAPFTILSPYDGPPRADGAGLPEPRGPLTEQQLSSGLPARAWKTMSWADALRSPSIGVL